MQPPSSPNRPLRSQPTRDRILAVARECFASRGFEGTTIRIVAAGAEVAPAMVIRYYDNKEGLFVAAAQIDLLLPDLTNVPTDALGERLVCHFLDRWEGKASDGQLQALLRASINHAGARAAITDIFETQLCASIAMTKADQPTLRAGLIASQMLGLALGRYILLLPALTTLDRQSVITMIAPTVQAYLATDLSQTGALRGA